MNNFKINIDRPKISSKDIQKKMNFEQILANHQLMATPFYKSPWFFGTTGLATITIIATTIYGFENKSSIVDDSLKRSEIATGTPPVITINHNESEKEIKQESKIINELPIEKKSTLKQKTTNQKLLVTNESVTNNSETEVSTETISEDINLTDKKEETKKVFNYFDFHPRISGKVNGNITKEELFDEKGLVTNTNVKVIHFELHLVDGAGGRVFIEDGNQLTTEMKDALKNVGKGDEIYFENINGLTVSGETVHLSPLKYAIMN